MVLEGTDYIFYTNRKGHKVLTYIFNQVSKKWTEMEGFVFQENSSTDKNFEGLPDEDILLGSWVGVYVYKDKQTRERSKELGIGIDENVDKNTFAIFCSQKDFVEFDITVNDKNKVFAANESPETNFKGTSYEAIIASPKLFEITLTVSEYPKNNTIATWLFGLVKEACSGSFVNKSRG